MSDWDWLICILEERSKVKPQAQREESVPRHDDRPEQDSEYEYDEAETDVFTFYLNVDLNSSGWRGRTQEPSSDEAAVPVPEDLDPSETIQPSTETVSEDVLPRNRMPAFEPQEMQIVDLHHDRPIIKYQNQVFECRWANMIGTDLLILPDDAAFDGPVLKQYKHFKIMAANSVKLISQKLTLYEKRDQTAYSLAGHPGDNPEDGEFYIPIDASESRRNQTNFLRRLAAAKQARGETDKVLTQSQKGINAMGPRKSKTGDPGPESNAAQSSSSTRADARGDVSPNSRSANLGLNSTVRSEHDSDEEDPSTPGPKRQKISNS